MWISRTYDKFRPGCPVKTSLPGLDFPGLDFQYHSLSKSMSSTKGGGGGGGDGWMDISALAHFNDLFFLPFLYSFFFRIASKVLIKLSRK